MIQRHDTYSHRKRSSGKKNFDGSANKPYSEVNMEPEGGRVYEDPEKLAANTGQGDYELTQCPAYESTSGITTMHTLCTKK